MMDSQINCSNCSKLVSHNNFCGECGSKLVIVDNCPICLNTTPLETTPCGHNVCNICIPQLKSNGNTCPICRKSLMNWKEEDNTPTDTFPVYNNTDVHVPAENIIIRNIFLCPLCNSQNHTSHQIDGRYCKNCKQYFNDFLRISEEQIVHYPIRDKEDVNPTIVRVCSLCLSDRYEIMGPQWDQNPKCLNCGTYNTIITSLTKREYQQMHNSFLFS